MWTQTVQLRCVLLVIIPCVAYAQGGALSYSMPGPPPSPASIGDALPLAPHIPPASQPSSQDSTKLSPAPTLGGDDMMQSSRLPAGAIAAIAIGSAVAIVVALGIVLRLICCCGSGQRMRSAGQESTPCRPKSALSSPSEQMFAQGRVDNDNFVRMPDVQYIPEAAKEARVDRGLQQGPAVPGILTQKLNELDNAWKLERGSVEVFTNGNERPEKLGGQGDAIMYKGRLRGHHAVAVNIVHKGPKKQEERILKDIRLMKACMDPNIVRFLGAEVRTIHILLAMELMACDLYTTLENDRTGDYKWEKRGKGIALCILQGLEYLHGLGLAHLGLKSHDIFLDSTGHAKIGILGSSTIVGTYSAMPTAAIAPLWASPEQINGEVCNTKADIWAFGTILWEICSGKKLVGRSELTLKVPDEAPQKVSDILKKCHSLRPGDRPTASAIISQLLES